MATTINHKFILNQGMSKTLIDQDICFFFLFDQSSLNTNEVTNLSTMIQELFQKYSNISSYQVILITFS